MTPVVEVIVGEIRGESHGVAGTSGGLLCEGEIKKG